MSRNFVVYGNCQAAVLADSLKFMPDVADNFDVRYFQSFEHPVAGRPEIDPEIMAHCAIFWNQVDEAVPFNFDGEFPADMRTISFPAVDIGVLWPLQTKDPLFGPEPGYDYGLFPYGDKVLIEVATEGLRGMAAVERCRELASQKLPDLDRYLEIEFNRLIRREQKAQVKLAPFVLSTFKCERLFWTYNHPTKRMMAEILNRLVAATWPKSRDPASTLYRVGGHIFRDWEPFDAFQVPIYPEIAERLGLCWWNSDLKYRFHGASELSQFEYVERYIEERIARQT